MRDAKPVAAIAEELVEHGCPPEEIDSVSIDMPPAFIKGCTKELPNARITFDKFHIVWHANAAVGKMRRIEQRSERRQRGRQGDLADDATADAGKQRPPLKNSVAAKVKKRRPVRSSIAASATTNFRTSCKTH